MLWHSYMLLTSSRICHIITTMRRYLIDPMEGEEYMVYLVGKSLNTDKNFAKVFVAFLEDVVADEEVSGKAVRLLLYAINQLDWNSLEFWLDPEQVMRDLGIGKRTFYRWLSILLKKGYIKRVKTHRYRFKPYSVVVGSMRKVKDEEFVGFG